jgi:hypothetical protein
MHYLANLILPVFVALVVALTSDPGELSLALLQRRAEALLYLYVMFAAPHWVWAGIAGLSGAGRWTVVGGFVGLHLLLGLVWFLVAQSTEAHAANGWFLYLLGAPVFMATGALTGRFMATRKSHQLA